MDNITAINLGTCPLQYLSVGYVGETGARPVKFDFSAWAEEYGAGVLQLLLQRPGDADPYPVVLDIDGTTATWTPDATDTAAQGQAQLVYTVGGVVVKNAIFRVLVAPSLGASGDPPEPYEDWLERLLTIAAEAQQSALDAAGSAEAAGTSAGAAAGSAGAAAQSALDAEAAKTGAETAAATAGQSATLAGEKAAQAAQSAQTAAQKATDAQQSAEDAQTAATAAGASADSAEESADNAEAAADGANQAKTDAQSAASAAAESEASAAASAAVAQELIDQIPDIEAEIDSKAPAIYESIGPAAIASFADGADNMPLKSLVVDIPITQEGSGDPSPENVRPFVGRTGLSVYHSDADTTTPTTEEITFPAEAGTVYGGALTINADGSGEVEDRYYYRDGGNLAWTKDTTSYPYTVFRGNSNLLYANNGKVSVFCSQYPSTTKNAAPAAGDNHVWMHYVSAANHWLVVRDDSKADMTAAEFKAAMSGVMFAIQRVKPVTYQLTAEQIRTLKGDNNIWSDAGDVMVEYPADTKSYVDTKTAALSGQIEMLEGDVDALERDVSDISALPIIAPPDVETLLDDGEYTDEAKIALQKALGIYEPPWELINDITLTEEGRIDLTADDDGIPYNLRGAFIMVYYPANTQSASTGYGRYCAADDKGQYLASETSKYASRAYASSKFCMVLRKGSFALMPFSVVANQGDRMAWSLKYSNGFAFDFGNITRIYMNVSDVEPAGTNIKIYAQRAY